MKFIPHTQEQLHALHLKQDVEYTIEYLNKDYFNGETTIEKAQAKVIIDNGKFTFVVPDPYGMDRFINEVKVI